MVDETATTEYIYTGVREIDVKLGKGIPLGTLGLIEGESAVGKSVLSQHVTYKTLCSTENSVAYYTSEYSATGLIAQMDSLSLPTLDYFLLDRLRIYSLSLRSYYQDTEKPFWVLTNHLSKLPEHFRLVIVDSIANLVTHTNLATTLDFFRVCKELCKQGRCVFLVAHSLTFDRETFSRASSLCDLHLKLSFVDHEGYGLVNVMEVLKLQWATTFAKKKFFFEVKPESGIQTIPLTELRV